MMDAMINQEAKYPQAVEYIQPTIRKQLEQRKERVEVELEDIKNALKLLDENPTFEKVHDAISKVQRGLLR